MKRFLYMPTGKVFGIIAIDLIVLASFASGYYLGNNDMVVLLTTWILLGLPLVFINVDFFSKRTIIDQEGIKYVSLTKTHKLLWEEIKLVELRRIYFGRTTREFLVFSKKYMEDSDLMKLTGPNEFIKMENKSISVLREVRKYWKGPIIGAENLEYPNK